MEKIIIKMLQDRNFSDMDDDGKPLPARDYSRGKKYPLSERAAKHVINAGWAKEIKEEKEEAPSPAKVNKKAPRRKARS